MTFSLVLAILLLSALAMTSPAFGQEFSWNAPDRAERVAALTPGRNIPAYTPENLFADWTQGQLDKWVAEHPGWNAEQACDQYAGQSPTDEHLTVEFPRHISPFGRVRSGDPGETKADDVFTTYCPFCGSLALSISYDPQNRYHGTTNCCRTELWGREEDFPPDYPLKPTETVKFLHLDDTWFEAPCTVYRDKQGVEWELFIRTLFDHKRWVDEGCNMVKGLGEKFEQTGDPLCAYKIAVILDQAADTYYGLPLSAENKLAKGKDGGPLTRAEWEAAPRPMIFEVGYLGPWCRRVPLGSPGWLNMFDEHIWVEPFARVRHHPAFKEYSRRTYGDPDALDRKVKEKMLRELSLMFKSVFSQKLLTNYQEANYVDMWLLGLLLQDEELISFAGPAAEVVMYNHSYHDGLNGEGAPNYMAMPGGYFYPFLRDPKGWLEYYPKFLEEHPFYFAADGELRRLTTVRGQQVEFGDQHQHAFPYGFLTDPAVVRQNEQIGSRNWAGYGVGILRVGGPGHRQELCLSYTRATLHNSQDALSLECWVDGVPVLRKGGYAAWWSNALFQWDRPEFAALKQMGYPKEPTEVARTGFEAWSWAYAHSPLCQNNVTVEDAAPGKGWGDNRGYGEVITFKGGEAGGEPGSEFQVLDVRDHYTWSRVDKQISDFRRTLIGVEGPGGRPYVLDITELAGEQTHTLFSSVFGDRVEDRLPEETAKAETLADVIFGEALPEETSDYTIYRQVRDISRTAPTNDTWDVTWATDVAALAPRDANGRPFQRPIPDDVGRVRMRMFGVPDQGDQAELLSGTGPWIGWIRQPLPGGAKLDGNVAFTDGRDFIIERRTGAEGEPLRSLFVRVLEGYREGEQSAIASVTPLEATSVSGPDRTIVALRIDGADGHTDTVIYQSEPGTVRLPDGTETDARYAVLRRSAEGSVIAADACRATSLTAPGFETQMPGDFTGEIVDIVGDITGTRQQSALIIRPDAPWPAGEDLKDRQLMIRVESDLRDPCNEGYRIARATSLADGLVRVDVQDAATFIESWHQVSVLPEDRPNVIRTWRPLVANGNTPWYRGMNLWFPERGKTYTIDRVNEVGGGHGGDTVELPGDVNLAADGIEIGDWFVVYATRPGQRVTVANDLSWRKEPSDGWEQYALRATGSVELRAPVTAGKLSYRVGDNPWQEAPQGKQSFTAQETQGHAVRIITGQPVGLNLQDFTAPALTRLALDDRELTPEQARDMGWIDAPRSLVIEFRDAENALDQGALAVTLNNAKLASGPGAPVSVQGNEEGNGLVITIDLEAAIAGAGPTTRRHVIDVAVADRSIEKRTSSVRVSFMNRMPLDAEATYLSDLRPVSSFAHGGLIRDRDYVGNPATIAGRIYPKCLTLCPEPSAEGAHGQVVYELPEAKPDLVLHTDIGISESSLGNGTVTFRVQVSDSPEGDWRTLYTSRVFRGGQEPETLAVALEGGRYLRLYTTDADDGINSDHAVWGGARVK